MNTIDFLKNGSHIKKKNRGKFTEYCNGKVTNECIARGKRSSDPAVRKMATFAQNSRKWKRGQIIKSEEGSKTSTWKKIGNFLSSDNGQSLLNGAFNLYSNLQSTQANNKMIQANADAQKAENEANLAAVQEQLLSQYQNDKLDFFNQWQQNYQSGLTLDRPSEIVANHVGYDQYNQKVRKAKDKVKNEALQTQAESQKESILGSASEGIFDLGQSLLNNYLNKTSTPSSTSTSSTNTSTISWTPTTNLGISYNVNTGMQYKTNWNPLQNMKFS